MSEKIKLKNRHVLLEMAKGLKKVDFYSVASEEFETKLYFSQLNLENSRIKYRERAGCLQTCRSQASSDLANMMAELKCYHCNSQDLVSHWFWCPGYSHINQKLDTDARICQFYKQVIEIRQQQDNS